MQAQILDLLKTLVREDGMGLLMITHDLAVVAQVSDDIMVLRNGDMVEYGSVQQIIEAPQEAIDEVIAATGASGPKDMGRVMGQLKGKLAGTAPSAALPEAGSTVQPVKVEEVDTELEELKRSIDKL